MSWEETSPPTLDGLELIRRIGRGSYGEVWLARAVMGGWRAVKVVRRERFDVDRPFEREFEGIQNYEPVSRDHPHLVHVLHAGRDEAGGCFHYVMELADDRTGADPVDPEKYQPRTLRGEIREHGALPVAECLKVGRALASALEHLHAHGLVHRDLKPSNVIFVGGEPKLADLGLVASAGGEQSFVGTEGYVPPEGPGTLAADLYGLGRVFYEMLTGRDRHDYPTLPPALLGAETDPRVQPFNRVVLMLRARDPAKRYPDAGTLAADLKRIAAGQRPAFETGQSRRRALVTVIGGLFAGGLFYALWPDGESSAFHFRDGFDAAKPHWRLGVEIEPVGTEVLVEAEFVTLTAEMRADAVAASHARITDGALRLKANSGSGQDFGTAHAVLTRPLPAEFVIRFKLTKPQWAGFFRCYLTAEAGVELPQTDYIWFGINGHTYGALLHSPDPENDQVEVVLSEPKMTLHTINTPLLVDIVRTQKGITVFLDNIVHLSYRGPLPPMKHLHFLTFQAGAEAVIDNLEIAPYAAK